MQTNTSINLCAIKNFITLDKETQLLFILIKALRPDGTIKKRKAELADVLQVTSQTVGKKLSQFVNTNILKYKYSGLMMINPEFCYKGVEEQKADVLRQYQLFKSDM